MGDSTFRKVKMCLLYIKKIKGEKRAQEKSHKKKKEKEGFQNKRKGQKEGMKRTNENLFAFFEKKRTRIQISKTLTMKMAAKM